MSLSQPFFEIKHLALKRRRLSASEQKEDRVCAVSAWPGTDREGAQYAPRYAPRSNIACGQQNDAKGSKFSSSTYLELFELRIRPPDWRGWQLGHGGNVRVPERLFLLSRLVHKCNNETAWLPCYAPLLAAHFIHHIILFKNASNLQQKMINTDCSSVEEERKRHSIASIRRTADFVNTLFFYIFFFTDITRSLNVLLVHPDIVRHSDVCLPIWQVR